ncbi:hypothetical protein [Egicoccus sp. AB-alg2]|uniref:hypothetical protein n=1 Tax=Egicoccus sp. AB-alg2 TaxID=3242693 RepID=UPI00359EB82B
MDLGALGLLEWIIVAVVVVLVVLTIAWLITRKKRQEREETRRRLKERFGAEYDRTLGAARNRRAAEEDLLARERRRQSFTIRPVPAEQRTALRTRWEEVQASFVDAPNAALRKADELLDEVAEARGYPDAAREQRLADLSVDHPAAVERYRSARAEGDDDQSTEQLRGALLASRDLFETLVSQGESGSTDTPPTPFQQLVSEEAPADGPASTGSAPTGPVSTGPGSNGPGSNGPAATGTTTTGPGSSPVNGGPNGAPPRTGEPMPDSPGETSARSETHDLPPEPR